jgi:hypothetical protein
MRKFYKLLSIFILLSFFCSSCGIIFGGSRFNGRIVATNHSTAEISVNGNKIGTGSATGLFKRNKPLVVEVKDPGCQPVTKTFDNTFRTGNFILSLVTWGLVGALVDIGTGASFKPDHKHDPNIQKLTTKDFAFTIDYKGCANSNE